MVLHLGGDEEISRLDEGIAPGLGHEVDRFRGAARPEDFFFARGVDPAGDGGAGGLETVGGFRAQGVRAAVHVGVAVLVKLGERLDHLPWLLGGGGVVEVDEGLAVDPSVQDGKVFAPALDGGRLRQRRRQGGGDGIGHGGGPLQG